jgi:hypothetical protein
MFEYGCTTVQIETEEALSLPSTKCHEDFETQIPFFGLRSACMNIAAASILAIVPYSAASSKSCLRDTLGPDCSSVITETIGTQVTRRISLHEAREMARKLQDRIDSDYQRLLEAEVGVIAIWEEEV